MLKTTTRIDIAVANGRPRHTDCPLAEESQPALDPEHYGALASE